VSKCLQQEWSQNKPKSSEEMVQDSREIGENHETTVNNPIEQEAERQRVFNEQEETIDEQNEPQNEQDIQRDHEQLQ
jgi:hypothetical protein